MMQRWQTRILLGAAGALLLLAGTRATAEGEAGFRPLFNGINLAGWWGKPEFWSVKDGVITGRTTPEQPPPGNTFLIWTNGTVRDFELRLAYRITANNPQGFANSGIQYRSKVVDRTHLVVAGYQADLEAGPNYSGILYEERGRGIMALRGQRVTFSPDNQKTIVGTVGDAAAMQAAIKTNDWNDYTIIAQGPHLRHFINGHLTVDVTDESTRGAQSGVLALQLHAGEPMTVEFKNIRLKPLRKAAAP